MRHDSLSIGGMEEKATYYTRRRLFELDVADRELKYTRDEYYQSEDDWRRDQRVRRIFFLQIPVTGRYITVVRKENKRIRTYENRIFHFGKNDNVETRKPDELLLEYRRRLFFI